MVTPIKQDLRVQPLRAAVTTSGITADANGFYYTAGEPVKIVGDAKVGKMAKIPGEVSIGLLNASFNKTQRMNGLDSRDRLPIITKYNFEVEGTAEGNLVAGDYIVDGTTTAGTYKAYDSTTNTVDQIKGIVWVGALTGKKFRFLM